MSRVERFKVKNEGYFTELSELGLPHWSYLSHFFAKVSVKPATK